MCALKHDDCSVIKNRKDIVERVKEFYSTLYQDTAEEININEQSEETPIILVEVKDAIKSMKNGKAAGKDQICIEMLKSGGEVLHKELAKLF